MQWLLGSGKSNPFYLLWSELADMDSIRFVNHEIRMEIEVKETRDIHGEKVFHLYTDLARLEKYMISIAPEDDTVIRKFISVMRKMQAYEIPPMIRSVPELLPWYKKTGYIKYLPLLMFLNRVKHETNITFARKLKNPFLKEAFTLLFDGQELPMLIITMPLAFGDLNGTGYPIGGSAGFVGLLEKKYNSLGGITRFGCETEKIVVENNQAVGIQLSGGEIIPADITISAADWNFTVFKALGGKFVNRTIQKLHRLETLEVYYSVFMVSLGVDLPFSDHPHFVRFPLIQQLVSPDGTKYDRMEVHLNNYDPTTAPSGKTVVSISFYTKNARYWIDLRKENKVGYTAEKEKFASMIIRMANARIAGLEEHIEVIDIATPATFQRYTGNWKGSVQGWLPGKNIIAQSPVKSELPGLKEFYYTGHWTIPGGGLPVAIKSARDVAQIICHRKKIPFKTRENGKSI
jgi:phytoene dehydrogenase-like protein